MGVGRMLEDAGTLPECEVKILMTHDYTTTQVCSSGYSQARICWSSDKTLTQDATRRLRFIVHAAGWLQSMVYHACMFFYITFGKKKQNGEH